MAGLEMLSAPSFSLGLDFDISNLPTDAEEDEENHQNKTHQNDQSSNSKEEEGPTFELFPDLNLGRNEEKSGFLYDHSFLLEASLSNQDLPCKPLKRLRRGPASLVQRFNCDNLKTCSIEDFCLKEDGDYSEQKPEEENLSNDITTKWNSNSSMNSTNLFHKFAESNELNLDLLNPKLPCYGYFCNDDLRIRVLVREMLPHFLPIGTTNSDEANNSQSVTQNIDNMVSFGTKEPQIGGWVNPRERALNKEDTSKRKIKSFGRKSGHWFTQHGKKVYVTKNGQELTGQSAYRNYRKESGVGYVKIKKKKTNSTRMRKSLNI